MYFELNTGNETEQSKEDCCWIGDENIFFSHGSFMWSITLTDDEFKEFLAFLTFGSSQNDNYSVIIGKNICCEIEEKDEGNHNIIISNGLRVIFNMESSVIQKLASFLKKERNIPAMCVWCEEKPASKFKSLEGCCSEACYDENNAGYNGNYN